jgi:hypothetical protein
VPPAIEGGGAGGGGGGAAAAGAVHTIKEEVRDACCACWCW